MITKTSYTGQLITSNHGFTMIETLVVAAILGALSLFAMEMLDRQNKMIKTVEAKLALQSVHSQLGEVVAKEANCMASFDAINIKSSLAAPKEDSGSLFDSLQKEFEFINGPDIEVELRPVFQTQTGDPKASYEGITIQKYTLSLREDNFIEDDSLSATVSFDIHYDLGPNILGGRYHRKSINLAMRFSDADPTVLTSCHSAKSSSTKGSSIAYLDPLTQPDYTNVSGNEACKSIGKTCLQVISQNYASKAYGQIGIGNLCQINYNQPLLGVKQGAPISNTHSCEAKLGQFETYKVEQAAFGVTCQGIFTAQCQ